MGGSPAEWKFESAGNGRYYLSVNGKYLQRYNKSQNNQNGWEARLVDNRNSATQFTVDVNNDGTILIHDGNYYLHNDGYGGTGEWQKRIFYFRNDATNTNSPAYRFRLCEESDQFDSFAARKVSVQDLTVNDSFLIYRKFEDSQGNEALYALASDGTFVRVYDGGDTVYWRETDKNVYWNYKLEGGYYSIYSTDPATNETVYINPMHSAEPPQTITSEPSRLTLIGKDNGDYGTALENWDHDSIHDALIGLAQKLEVKNGTVMWPARIAVAGKTVTPGGAIEILDILGKEESLRRPAKRSSTKYMRKRSGSERPSIQRSRDAS